MLLSHLHFKIKRESLLLLFATVILGAAVGKDLLVSHIKDYSFYLSESLLFETFWILFIPLMLWARSVVKSSDKKMAAALILLLSILHILLFSIWVYTISALFFYQPFSFLWLLTETSLDHGISCLLIYGLGILIIRRKKSQPPQLTTPETTKLLTVSQGNNTVVVDPDKILYVRSETPYIALITENNTYLLNSTLKAFIHKNASEGFIRIHKSTIVNTAFVKTYRSRKNGDYDITLTNGEVLRLSRNYGKSFKLVFG
jgi:hypothetical protein